MKREPLMRLRLMTDEAGEISSLKGSNVNADNFNTGWRFLSISLSAALFGALHVCDDEANHAVGDV